MEIKEEVKFKVPEMHVTISNAAAILIGASMITGALVYVYSPENMRLHGTTNGQQIAATAPVVPDTTQGQAAAGAGNTGPTQGATKANVTVGDLPTLGNANAPVTVVEWADFQCPFCGRFFSEVEGKLISDYVNTGKVKFAFRDFAFLGQESKDAANAARCANAQGKFWPYHDYLYSHQGGENQGAFSKDNLKKFGVAVGLNAAQFNACVDANTYSAQVDADVKAGQDAGVNGTPTTFVNGKLISGAQPYSQFKQEIDAALAGK